MACLLFWSTGKSQSREQVYSGMILHIMKYVEWPAYKNDKMTIGIMDDPKLVASMNKKAVGKQVHFKNISVLKLTDAASLATLDLLFVPKRSHKLLPKASAAAAKSKVLIVSEGGSITLQGVAFSFEQKQGRLQLELSQGKLDKYGFKVSQQLKRFAVVKS